MSFNNTITPPRLPRVVGSTLQPVRQEIVEFQRIKRAKQNVIWGTFNLILLAVVVNDMLAFCDNKNKYQKYFFYFEHVLAVIFLLNCLYHLYKYCTMNGKTNEKKDSKLNQSVNLNNTTLNSSFNTSLTDLNRTPYQNVITSRFSKTPTDTSAASWLSTSANQSLNQTNWSFQAETPTGNSPGFKSSPILPANLNNMALVDEHSLSQYLKEYETIETTQNVNIEPPTTNSLTFFWNHAATKNKDSSPLLRRCQYQLSTPSPTNSTSPKTDDKSSPLNQSQCSDTWKRLNVDSVALTQWTENLRVWISQTILCRLISEFSTIDKSLHAQGLTDVTIGKVGLDRLRKTAQGQVLQNTPNLPTIVTFLELHANQEYLVQRIRELAKGGCMSEYKWNGGGHFNEKEWDLTLPTDAAIIMHLTAAYLDTQLVPLPNNPDVKPFNGFHFIKSTEKLPEPNANTLAIHEVSSKPPHYRIIIGTESYEMVKGYNNLFHSILFFLYHVNKREHGMLGRVNLGRSGLNMLWIINAN